ncbi:MAG: hypothetical protein AAF628_13135 [Planctomycetota bacterium]
MMRLILAVVAGYAVWTAVWLGGNAALLPEAAAAVQAGEAFTDPGALGLALALSAACSLCAGGVAATIAGGPMAWRAAWITAGLLLATGVAVQAGVWSLMPLWYHLVFLALLVPVTLLGARLRWRAGPAASAPR